MRIPKFPPDPDDILQKFFKEEEWGKLQTLMSAIPSVNTHNTYSHWDKIRFSKPFSKFSAQENWYIIKSARRATMRYLPFDAIKPAEHALHFTRPDCLLSLLSGLDRQIGGIVSASSDKISKSDAQRYLQRSFLEEPFSSSVLEGAITTRERARQLIDTGEVPDSLSDRMVVNNYQAMSFIKQHLDDDLTPEFILECQEIITHQTLDRSEMSGKLRDSDNVFVGDDFGNVFHIPPDFKTLSRRLEMICEFANAPVEENHPYFHPLVKAIIIHFMIAYDHPFVDGNGRTARALFYWFALKSGYWMAEYTSISSVINEAPKKYGLSFLYTETDQNDLTYFILYQLDVLEKAIKNLQIYMERQRSISDELEANLKDPTLNHRQKTLLSDMIRDRIQSIQISPHEERHNISYLTARKDLEDLGKANWLLKKKIGRDSVYFKGRKFSQLTNSSR